MFSLFQITIHSHKQLLPIHSQTFLHFIPASPSLHPHLWPLRDVFVCLLVWLCRMAVEMNDNRYSCSLTTVNPERVLVSIRLL